MSNVKITGNASGSGSLTIAAPNTNSDLTLNLPTTLGNNGTSALVSTDASGNLGLGVTPSAWNSQWTVQDFKGASAVFAFNTTTDPAIISGVNVYVDGSSSTANAKYKVSSEEASMYRQYQGTHAWFTAPSGTAGNSITFTQAMTLDASGRLLVGPTSTLLSSSGIRAPIQSASASSSEGGLILQNASNGTGSPAIYSTKTRSGTVGVYTSAVQAGDGLMYISGEGADGVSALRRGGAIGINAEATFTATSSPGWIGFFTTPSGSTTVAERARITSDGYLRMASSSLGIQFGGNTAAANALDDYEEGTFTPTIVGTTTAGTGTYSVQTGNYTKVGNLVTCTVRLTWSAHTGTGNMRISGLPFTAATQNSGYAAAFAENMTVTGQVFTGGVSVGNTFNTLYAVNNGTSALLAMDTAAGIFVVFSYFA